MALKPQIPFNRSSDAARDVADTAGQVGGLNKFGNGLTTAGDVASLGGLALFLATGASKIFGKGAGAVGFERGKNWGEKGNRKLTKFGELTLSDMAFGGKPMDSSILNKAGDRLNKVPGISVGAKVSEANVTRHTKKLVELGEKAKTNLSGGAAREAQKFLKSVGNTDNEQVTKAITKFQDSIKSKNLTKEQGKLVDKMVRTAQKASNSRTNALYFRKPGNFLKALPRALGKTPLLAAVSSVFFIGSSLVSLVGAVVNTVKDVSALKAMSKDITGKEVSAWDVVRGNIPEEVKAARAIFKNTGVSASMDALSLGLNVVGAVKGNVSILTGFFGPQLAGMAMNTLISESALPKYKELSQMHASGQKITGEDYAELIGIASPALVARGGAKSAFAQELGAIYAEKGLSPAKVIQRIAKKITDKDIEAIMAANEAAKPAAVATSAAVAATATPPATEHVTQAAGSHVAALQKPAHKAAALEQKPVVGKHTDQLAKMVRDASLANEALLRTT